MTRRLPVAFAAILALVLATAPAMAAPGEVSAEVTGAEASAFRRVVEAIEAGHWDRARQIAQASNPVSADPAAAKLLTWLEIIRRPDSVPFETIAEFLRNNPEWPFRRQIEQRAEAAIAASSSARDVVAWFKAHPPRSSNGLIALGDALAELGRSEEAAQAIRRAWVEGDFGAKQERAYATRHRKILTQRDHGNRLDRLLWEGQIEPAQRMLLRVDRSDRLMAEARIGLRSMSGGIDRALRRLSPQQMTQPGVLYERLRWRRQKERDDDAVALLALPHAEEEHAGQWWNERSILSRRLLAKGHVSEAYRMASGHRLTNGIAFGEAEWTAGWIALRFLRDHAAAASHFRRMVAAAETPVGKSRAAYWLGRAVEAKGAANESQSSYRQAAQFPATYHGQLAAARIGVKLEAPPREPRPSPARLDAFNKQDLTRATVLLATVGQTQYLRPFLTALSRSGDKPEDFRLAGELAVRLGRIDFGVAIARDAYRRGHQLTELGYPVIETPRNGPERGLLHAVMRQESNFDAKAESGAGALGLMQLMPNTARGVAKQVGVGYSKTRLGEPSYNIRLGAAYLASLLSQFDGSYVLALAGYNAGPGSVQKWIKRFGDPRKKDVDVVDWIEMIPYGETRFYVQHVLENLQVYRHLMGGGAELVSLEEDLKRGVRDRG